jgi:hypothetical protein
MFWQKKTILAGGPLTLLLLLAFGRYHDLFHTTDWYDIFMHFLGGGLFIITLCGFIWHLRLKKNPGRMPGSALFKAGLITALLLTAVLWECFEVLFNLSPNWTHSVKDTVLDMVCGLAGAAVALLVVFPKERCRNRR